jgi:hypothetical protein
MEMYRFRFARVCVPLFDSAFLFASAWEAVLDLSVTTCGVDALGSGDSGVMFPTLISLEMVDLR